MARGTINILKKYSRAAGDRSHWVKAEAMLLLVRKAPGASLRGLCHVPDHREHNHGHAHHRQHGPLLRDHEGSLVVHGSLSRL